jgi:hypothetical protein
LPNLVINTTAAFFAASRSSHRQQPWGDLSLPPFTFLSLLIVFPMILIIKDKLLFIPFKENGKWSFICILILVLDWISESLIQWMCSENVPFYIYAEI